MVGNIIAIFLLIIASFMLALNEKFTKTKQEPTCLLRFFGISILLILVGAISGLIVAALSHTCVRVLKMFSY